METCEYCNGEMELHPVTLLSLGEREWRGCCARCGHVVSHIEGSPALRPWRLAS